MCASRYCVRIKQRMGEQVVKQRIAAVTCVLLVGLPFAARAETTAETLRALDQCAGLADEHQRLGCFDQLGPQVKAALARMGAASGPPTAQEQKNWFGFDIGGLFGSSPAQQTTPQKSSAANAFRHSRPRPASRRRWRRSTTSPPR